MASHTTIMDDEFQQLLGIIRELAQGVLAQGQRIEELQHRVRQLENAQVARLLQPPHDFNQSYEG